MSTNKYIRFVDIASQVIKESRIPLYSCKFSKKTYTQHQLLTLLLLKEYLAEDYRDTVELVDDGFFWLDAGAMFGVVPKAIWEKKVVVDPRNRLRLTCNVPLIRTGERNIIIDTGCGDKWDPKSRDMYAIDDIYLYDELPAHGSIFVGT